MLIDYFFIWCFSNLNYSWSWGSEMFDVFLNLLCRIILENLEKGVCFKMQICEGFFLDYFSQVGLSFYSMKTF